MADAPQILTGVIRGDTIRVEQSLGLPDGKQIRFAVLDEDRWEHLTKAFGGWAEDTEELDEYLRQTREARKAR